MAFLPSKTFRFVVRHHSLNMGKWCGRTKQLYNKIVEFYFGVCEQHQEVLELNAKDALTYLERLTHKTADNPKPKVPMDLDVLIPAMFRRAAIHTAFGAAQSFHSNLERWKKQKAVVEAKGKRFKTKPPVPPRVWNFNPVFYAGQAKDLTNHTIMLKLWTGSSWAWMKMYLQGRGISKGWTPQSPVLVSTDGYWHLHVPTIKQAFSKPKQIKEQIKNPKLRVCSVDLNINDNLAVCTILRADGSVMATKFIAGGKSLQHRRKRVLGIVADHRKKTGIIQEGVQDNVRRWRKIRRIDDDTAHKVSRDIVEFAVQHKAKVLVFEHLGNFKPTKGKYSRRGNEKRTYWLRGKIFRFAKYKAWECGILTSRVNPAYTSQRCGVCGTDVYRYMRMRDDTFPYRPGAPNWWCPKCDVFGNADRQAAIHIGLKFFRRYKEKPKKKLLGVARSQVGSSNRRGTSRDIPRSVRSPGRSYATNTGRHANARVS